MFWVRPKGLSEAGGRRRHGSPVRRRLGEGRLIAAVSAALLDEFDRGMYQAKCPPLGAAG